MTDPIVTEQARTLIHTSNQYYTIPQVELGQFTTLLDQTFQGARHVKAYGMEDYEARRAERLIGRIVFMVVTLIAFYFVLPGLLATFDALPRLRDVYPAWFVVVLLLESASFDFVSIRRTFRHFDLPSEASARFSRFSPARNMVSSTRRFVSSPIQG